MNNIHTLRERRFSQLQKRKFCQLSLSHCTMYSLLILKLNMNEKEDEEQTWTWMFSIMRRQKYKKLFQWLDFL